MNELKSIRANVFYVKESKKNPDDEDNFIKHLEFVLLVDNAKYSQTNEGHIVRERQLQEFKFVINSEAVDKLVKTLEAFSKAENEDLI